VLLNGLRVPSGWQLYSCEPHRAFIDVSGLYTGGSRCYEELLSLATAATVPKPADLAGAGFAGAAGLCSWQDQEIGLWVFDGF
jgi:hypothetical protein